MRFVRIKAIARKEFIQIRRDPLSLAAAFVIPALLLVIFGYAITMDIRHIPTIVYDCDRSSLSREFVAELRESGYFSITAYVDEYKKIDRYLDAGEAKVAIVFPAVFFKNLMTGKGSTLDVIVDGSNANTATIALGYVAAISETFVKKIAGAAKAPGRIDPRFRVWYNPELKSRVFIIPGLIAVIMAVIAALLTSLTVAREWDRGTMEQLIATPVKKSELILGKLIPYFVIGFIDMVVAVFVAVFIFDVPVRGSLPLLIMLSCLFLFGALGMGILISIIAKTQLAASQAAMVATFLPAFLLSGFMFSIANMSVVLQILTYIVPARYFVSILKGIFLKGSSLNLLMTEVLLLSLFGLVVFVVANKIFVKRID